MKVATLVMLLTALAAHARGSVHEFRSMWAEFKLENKLSYDSIDEDTKRYNIFKERVSELEALRESTDLQLKTPSEIGVDLVMTDAELGYIPHNVGSRRNARSTFDEPVFDIAQTQFEYPAELDYRNYKNSNWVTPVKYQGKCGTCWSFATMGSLDSVYWLNFGEEHNFSMQQLLDCNSYGVVETGRTVYVTDYFEKTEYYATFEEYPYVAADRGCVHQDCRAETGEGWIHIPYRKTILFPNREDYLIHYLNNFGPIVAGIFVNTAVNSGYKSGIINRDGCRPNGGSDNAVNHAVVIVGYGVDNETGVPYWTIKNSHGTWNDDNGYVRYMRGEGVCNIDIGNVTYGAIQLRDCAAFDSADACNSGMGCLWCNSSQKCYSLDLFSEDYYEANCKACSAYTPQGEGCPAGCTPCDSLNVCAEGACPKVEQCECTAADGPCCDGCLFKANGTFCRAAAGPCENEGRCSGKSAECPGPVYKPSSTVCRLGLDDYVFGDGDMPEHGCDVTEYCTGKSAECPEDDIWTKESSTFYDVNINESAATNDEFGNKTGYSYCLMSTQPMDSFGNKYGMCRAGRCVHPECYDEMNKYTLLTGWFNMECCVDGNYFNWGTCTAGRCIRKVKSEDKSADKLAKSEKKVKSLTIAVIFLAGITVILAAFLVALIAPKFVKRSSYTSIDSVDLSSR